MVTESWQGRQAGQSPAQGDTGVRVFTYVGIGDEAAARTELKNAFDVHQNAQWDDADPDLICQSVFARRKSPLMQELTASYAYAPTGFFQPTADPLTLPWRYTWEPVTLTIPIDRDADGNPILNSAYDPPSSPPTKKVTFWCLRVLSNEPFFDYALFNPFNNTVNSDTITLTQPNGNDTTFGPGTIFCDLIRPTRDYTANDLFVPVERVLHIYDTSQLDNQTDPHQLHLLDQGSAGFYDDDDGTVKPGNIVDGVGNPVPQDVPLDGYGRPVKAGLMIAPAKDGKPQNFVAAPLGTPQGAVIEPSNNTDFPAVFLRWKRYQPKPLLSLLSPPPPPLAT